MKVKRPGAAVYTVVSIASNEDHVGNMVAEGVIPESEYWLEVAMLYKGQLAAKQLEFVSIRRRYERAAARAKDAEAKLAEAVEALGECEAEIDDYIRHEYPGANKLHERYRRRDFSANPARIALKELKGGEK